MTTPTNDDRIPVFSGPEYTTPTAPFAPQTPQNAPAVPPVNAPSEPDSRDAELADLRRQLEAERAKNAPTNAAPTDLETEVYLWLANGEVVKVKESEVPGYGGTNAANGHYTKDGNSFQIVGVYPVETPVKEG